MSIKNIIFDLGGVILNIDYQKTALAFRELGVRNFDQAYSQHKQTLLFDDFETGKISNANFRRNLQELLKVSVTATEFDKA